MPAIPEFTTQSRDLKDGKVDGTFLIPIKLEAAKANMEYLQSRKGQNERHHVPTFQS